MNTPDNNIENPETVKQKLGSKRRRVWALLGWLSVAVLVLPVASCEFVAQLNAHGVCVSQARRIPDEELIRPWVEAIVENYPEPGMSFTRIQKINDKWVPTLRHYDEPIPYHDVVEFFALNPDCCTVQTFDPETGYTPDESQHRWGFGRGFVKIEYKLRYRAKDGLEKSDIFLNTKPVTNCGEYWKPF